MDLNFPNALRHAYFRCLPSVMRSFTELYKRNFEIKNDYNLRMNFILCTQICHFLDVSGKVLSLIIVLQMTLVHFTIS